MTTTTAGTIPWPDSIATGYIPEYTCREDIISSWREIREKSILPNLLDYPISEIKKRVGELYSFVQSHKEHFIVERRPVFDDMLRDHFKEHYSHLNELVSDKVLSPRDAVKVGRYIYLYDCVYPHLSEDVIEPRENPEEKMSIAVIPSKLYDWMVKLDYLWLKLLIKKKIDRETLESLDKNYETFVRDAVKLKVFLPIPPRKMHDRRLDLEELLLRTRFRRVSVNWEVIVENFYRETVNFLSCL